MATAPDDDPQNQWRTRAAELARLDLEVRRFHAYRDNHPDYIPTEADRRELQDRLDRIDTLTAQERDDMATMVTTSAPGHTSHPSRAEQLRDGRPLTAGDTFTAWTRDRGRAEGRDTGEDLDLERYLRGLVTGDWRDADNERRAMGGTTGALGGYAVPLALSARIIDLARPRTRCLEAGATIVPMATAHVDVATWVEDPTPAWRTEHAAIAVDDAGLGKIRLSARSLAVIVKVSRELLEDATAGGGVENALSNAFAAQAAQSLDYAALFGTGTANNPDAVPGLPTDAPRGIAATTGVAKTSLGTNGATLDWDDLLDAQHELATRNEEATASITAPRTVRDLRKLKDSTGQYLTPPADLPPTLATNLVPVNQTHGTATTATSLIMGDYSQLYLGIRTDLQIIPLRERYADNGQVGFLLWFRGDVAVARPGAFQVVEGIIPA
jgi:HK97 family phage major capsid protein